MTTAAGGALSELSALEAPQYLGILDVQPRNLVGLLIGAAVVFLFSGLRSTRWPAPPGRSSSRCAGSSGSVPGSWRAPRSREYGKVVDICTRDSLRELSTLACWPS